MFTKFLTFHGWKLPQDRKSVRKSVNPSALRRPHQLDEIRGNTRKLRRLAGAGPNLSEVKTLVARKLLEQVRRLAAS